MPDLNPYSETAVPGAIRVTLGGDVRIDAKVVESTPNKLSRVQPLVKDLTAANRLTLSGMLGTLDEAGRLELAGWLFHRHLAAETPTWEKQAKLKRGEP